MVESVVEELEWDSFTLQYEHIDWNDIVDAELAGDSETLLQLKNKSQEVRKARRGDSQEQSTCSPLSYAEVVGPAQHGVKRTASERACLSPIDCCPKRNVRSRVENFKAELDHTPPVTTEFSVDENTPESNSILFTKAGSVQRRLFYSPKSDQSQSPGNSPNQVQQLTLHRINQRQKQIDFGKNTLGYQRYIQTIPKWQRKPLDPVTPDKHKAVSTRAWQGQIRLWRRALHSYDPPVEDTFTTDEAALCEMSQ